MNQKTIYNPEIHHRRSIRLKGYDYSRSGAYFITICTRNRECLFGEIENREMRLNEFGDIVQTCWKWLGHQYEYVGIDQFVVMPNHVHGILILNHGDQHVGAVREPPLQQPPLQQPPLQQPPLRSSQSGQSALPVKPRKSIGRLIGAYKTVSSKQINQIRGTPGMPVWQRNYYEHIIRDDQDYKCIAEYIMNNPLKWEMDENYPLYESPQTRYRKITAS
jgi:putative transposase